MPDKKPKLDFASYNLAQIKDALTCPINRHATRVRHGCDDWGLHEHPEWLLENYIEKGGAVAFAKRRAEFVSLCDLADRCRFADDCELALTRSGYLHCPLRKMSEHCRTLCVPPLDVQ